MWTLLGLIIVCAASYAYGWAHGSRAGFEKAVEQLDRIVRMVTGEPTPPQRPVSSEPPRRRRIQ